MSSTTDHIVLQEWMTTTESFMSQINLKDDYRLRGKKPILDMKDTIKEMLERYV